MPSRLRFWKVVKEVGFLRLKGQERLTLKRFERSLKPLSKSQP